jgi:hypothetical protein
MDRQRSIIETINDQLKNISQIEHSKHRSPVNFCINVLCGLIAYCPAEGTRSDNPKSLVFISIGFYLNLFNPN